MKQSNSLLIGFILLAAVAMIYFRNGNRSGGGSMTAGRAVDVAEISSDLKEQDLVLIKFGADWCPPCRQIEKELDQLETQSLGVKVIKIDIDQRGDISSKYGIGGIPHLMLVRNGKSLEERAGFHSADELTALIKKHN